MRLLDSLKHSTLPLAILLGLVACGGGHTSSPDQPAPSSGLTYVDPPATGWRLVKDSSSTATHLVLNLVGPAGEKGRGVGFNLRSDGRVKFARFSNGTYIRDLGVFQLGNMMGPVDAAGGAATTDVVALIGGVKEGGLLLSVGAFQKDRRWPAQTLAAPLFQVALDFDSQLLKGTTAGTPVPLTFVRGRAIPEDIGDNPDDPNANPYSWIFKYKIDEVQVAVGTLSTR